MVNDSGSASRGETSDMGGEIIAGLIPWSVNSVADNVAFLWCAEKGPLHSSESFSNEPRKVT